jgi:hypothetical protein
VRSDHSRIRAEECHQFKSDDVRLKDDEQVTRGAKSTGVVWEKILHGLCIFCIDYVFLLDKIPRWKNWPKVAEKTRIKMRDEIPSG